LRTARSWIGAFTFLGRILANHFCSTNMLLEHFLLTIYLGYIPIVHWVYIDFTMTRVVY